MMDGPAASAFPPDTIARAQRYLSSMGGVGAYTDSRGAPVLREEICKGIERRDGYPAHPNDIFMTDGATPCVHAALKCLLRDEKDAILTPIPQYPLYSACITLYDGTLLPYYLDEERGWSCSIDSMRSVVHQARQEGKNVRALVVINPGNPTGQCLGYQNQVEIVKFCNEEGIILMADEVYQTNVYHPERNFTSFKKVIRDLGDECANLPLFSMMSTSKGFYGECGRRGGYMEVVNVTPEVQATLYKLASINLCANTAGQVTMACVMNPPQEGEPSFAQYDQEKRGLLDSLARRAKKLSAAMNTQMEWVSCNDPEGAMYLFPTITIPKQAEEYAATLGKKGEWVYCMSLLEEEGIVCVPGGGFGQKEGTAHFRITFLPSEEDMDNVVERLTRFHKSFLAKYGGI